MTRVRAPGVLGASYVARAARGRDTCARSTSVALRPTSPSSAGGRVPASEVTEVGEVVDPAPVGVAELVRDRGRLDHLARGRRRDPRGPAQRGRLAGPGLLRPGWGVADPDRRVAAARLPRARGVPGRPPPAEPGAGPCRGRGAGARARHERRGRPAAALATQSAESSPRTCGAWARASSRSSARATRSAGGCSPTAVAAACCAWRRPTASGSAGSWSSRTARCSRPSVPGCCRSRTPTRRSFRRARATAALAAAVARLADNARRDLRAEGVHELDGVHASLVRGSERRDGLTLAGVLSAPEAMVAGDGRRAPVAVRVALRVSVPRRGRGRHDHRRRRGVGARAAPVRSSRGDGPVTVPVLAGLGDPAAPPVRGPGLSATRRIRRSSCPVSWSVTFTRQGYGILSRGAGAVRPTDHRVPRDRSRHRAMAVRQLWRRTGQRPRQLQGRLPGVGARPARGAPPGRGG